MNATASLRSLAVLSGAAVALAGVRAQSARADIIYSGVLNVAIPVSGTSPSNGLYIDFQGLTIRTGTTVVAGEDLKLTANTASGNTSFITATSSVFSSAGAILFTNTTGTPPNIGPIASDTPIGPSQTFASIGGGTIGASASALTNYQNQTRFIGFRIRTATANVFNYGWLQLQVGADFRSATLVDFAYEDRTNTTITAGAIPTPGAAVMLGLGAFASLRRRRRA